MEVQRLLLMKGSSKVIRRHLREAERELRSQKKK
jgi:hypothetical protein